MCFVIVVIAAIIVTCLVEANTNSTLVGIIVGALTLVVGSIFAAYINSNSSSDAGSDYRPPSEEALKSKHKYDDIAARLRKIRSPWQASQFKKGSGITTKTKDGSIVSVIHEHIYRPSNHYDEPDQNTNIYYVEVDGECICSAYGYDNSIYDFYYKTSGQDKIDAERKRSEIRETIKQHEETAARAKEEQRKKQDYINRIK